MKIGKIILLLIFLLTGFALVPGQKSSDGAWKFNCLELDKIDFELQFNEIKCSEEEFEIKFKYFIGKSDPFQRFYFLAENLTESSGQLNLLELSPSFDKDDNTQPFWFTFSLRSGGGFLVEPGQKEFMQLTFVGVNPRNISNGRNGSVEPGTYQGVLRIQDNITGRVYTFKITVFAIEQGDVEK